jgi:hypothetical protein
MPGAVRCAPRAPGLDPASQRDLENTWISLKAACDGFRGPCSQLWTVLAETLSRRAKTARDVPFLIRSLVNSSPPTSGGRSGRGRRRIPGSPSEEAGFRASCLLSLREWSGLVPRPGHPRTVDPRWHTLTDWSFLCFWNSLVDLFYAQPGDVPRRSFRSTGRGDSECALLCRTRGRSRGIQWVRLQSDRDPISCDSGPTEVGPTGPLETISGFRPSKRSTENPSPDR